MSLRGTDVIFIDPAAIAYIEGKEIAEGMELAKFEVIEYFFEWLQSQPRSHQLSFLKQALSE